MKNIAHVLKKKEHELQQLQGEVDALRVAIQLLSEEGEGQGLSLAPTGTSSESHVKEINAGPSTPRRFP